MWIRRLLSSRSLPSPSISQNIKYFIQSVLSEWEAEERNSGFEYVFRKRLACDKYLGGYCISVVTGNLCSPGTLSLQVRLSNKQAGFYSPYGFCFDRQTPLFPQAWLEHFDYLKNRHLQKSSFLSSFLSTKALFVRQTVLSSCEVLIGLLFDVWPMHFLWDDVLLFCTKGAFTVIHVNVGLTGFSIFSINFELFRL